jgi:hypothetical protein
MLMKKYINENYKLIDLTIYSLGFIFKLIDLIYFYHMLYQIFYCVKTYLPFCNKVYYVLY